MTQIIVELIIHRLHICPKVNIYEEIFTTNKVSFHNDNKQSSTIFHTPNISAIPKNFRGQCLRICAFFHVCYVVHFKRRDSPYVVLL